MTDDSHFEVPKRTTPTWDMELLISGATTFGLLQVPGLIDRWSIWALTENQMEVQQFVFTLTLYLQFSVLSLVVTFLLHLVLRGYWVALVGMHSVYPDGIRWEAFTRTAPVATEVMKSVAPDFDTLVERADNRATWVFGLGFGLALMMAWPAIVVGALSLVLVLAQKFEWPMAPISLGFWILFGLFVLPIMVAGLVDKVVGARWLAEERAGGLFALFRFYHWLGMSRASNPLIALVQSHSRNPYVTLMMVTAVIAVMASVAMWTLFRMSSLETGAFDGLPATSSAHGRVLFDSHYADSRDRSGTANSPFIPSRVARGDYLPLFVPYRPLVMNRVMAEACPDALLPEARDRGDGLACIARLLDARLDGKPLAIELFSATDPASGQRGSLAMIDIRDLPRGRHVLDLQRLPKPKRFAADQDDRHAIEFWR